MTIDASPARFDEVRALRGRHREEMDCQIVLDSWHQRGWADSWLLGRDGRVVGYGSVGGVRAEPKETVIEFYVGPEDRGAALPLFRRFVAASRATRIEAQTNDLLLTLMLLDCAAEIERNEVLFGDAMTTNLSVPGATFRRADDGDRSRPFPADLDSEAEWLVESGGEVVATGGVLFHYNSPYGDLYMAVSAPFRRRGFGGFLVQEMKRACRERGKVPAARCSPNNPASRATLQKAGMFPCARMLVGTLTT